MTFENLGLSPKVLAAVHSAGYTTPTPIQQEAIPAAVAGRDVLGIAQTGTGKTGAFVLPMLTRLERGRARARMPRSLILEPTRELAAQVAEQFALFGDAHKLTVALLIGGVSFDDQDKKLDRGADVVIATPGRLLDHFGRGKLLMNGIEILVVDESDRMLDMGFIPDIERICRVLPKTRQTLFFSATMPPEIQRLVDNFLTRPERISVSPPATAASTIAQRLKWTDSDPKSKREALRKLMREHDVRNGIVFCNRKRDVSVVHRSLVKHGFNAGALHGDLDQRQRMATLEAFRNGEITFLAASDVAARGLDIPDVSHIFNYDVPVHPEDYVHRIGRTGRAGKEGFTAMLVTPREMGAVKAIEKLLRQEIPWIETPPATDADDEGGRGRRGDRGRGGRSGRSPSRRSNGKAAEAVSPEMSETPPETAPSEAAPSEAAFTEAAPSGPKPQRRGERNPRRTSRGERREPQDAGSVQPKAAPTPVPAASKSARPEPAAKPERREPRHRATGQKSGGSAAPGMGDHVPAFMMRSVRPAD